MDFSSFDWLVVADQILTVWNKAPWPLQVLALLAPLILALLSRSFLAVLWVLAVNGLAILAVAANLRGLPPLGAALVLYAMALLGSFLGILERRQRRAAAAMAQRMQELDSQVTGFLEGLDRRARIIEEASAKLRIQRSAHQQGSPGTADPRRADQAQQE
jgi:hypothetical protein